MHCLHFEFLKFRIWKLSNFTSAHSLRCPSNITLRTVYKLVPSCIVCNEDNVPYSMEIGIVWVLIIIFFKFVSEIINVTSERRIKQVEHCIFHFYNL